MPTNVVQVWWMVIIGTTFLFILGMGLVAALVISQRRSLLAERRRLEEQRLAEQRFRDLVTASPIPIVVESRRGIAYANSAAVALFGGSAGESLITRSLSELLGSPMAREYSELLESVIRDKKLAPRRELSITTPAGSKRIIELSACPAVFGGEDAAQVVLVDLTDRKQAEDALARETERLAVTLRSIKDGVISCDSDGIVRLMNTACETLTGWQSEAARGRPIGEILCIRREADGARVQDIMKTVSAGESLLGSGGHGFLTAKDGSTRIIEAEGALIQVRAGESRGAVIAIRDVTAKKRIEEEMIRAEKMEAVGLLAASIAHDFNNILAAVLADLSVARSLVSESDELSEVLSEARTATLRAREITRQFQVFSTDGRQIRRCTSLAALLKETTAFTLRGLPVSHTLKIAGNVWSVEVDSGQMSQVFTNLLINAVEAMPTGGEITVVAENVVIDASSSGSLSPGRYVCAKFADQGCGIPDDHMARVFDPFFSTKPKGSGLGLASVHAIVRAHGGHVDVESEPGHGATFSVYLPAAVDSQKQANGSERTARSGSTRVLIADNDRDLRKSMCRLLEHMGCEVDIVPDGSDTVAVYREARDDGRRFDVVIVDLSGDADLSGAAAARELLKVDPGMRAIAASGHFDTKIFPKGSQKLFRALLFKPFTEEELREAIGRALA